MPSAARSTRLHDRACIAAPEAMSTKKAGNTERTENGNAQTESALKIGLAPRAIVEQRIIVYQACTTVLDILVRIRYF